MSHDLVRFDAWFSACYERLRRYLGPDGPDEDTFHDTYLLVREKARSPEVDILDFGAYFCGCYRRISLHKRCTPHCCIHPGEDFFLRLGAEGPAVPEGDLRACDRLVQDILEFVRRNFSYGEYRLFTLRYYETCGQCSYRTLAEYAGATPSEISRKVRGVVQAVRRNRCFALRSYMLAAAVESPYAAYA